MWILPGLLWEEADIERGEVEGSTRDDSLPKTILQGIMEGGRRRGRQRKRWMDNIKE